MNTVTPPHSEIAETSIRLEKLGFRKSGFSILTGPQVHVEGVRKVRASRVCVRVCFLIQTTKTKI